MEIDVEKDLKHKILTLKAEIYDLTKLYEESYEELRKESELRLDTLREIALILFDDVGDSIRYDAIVERAKEIKNLLDQNTNAKNTIYEDVEVDVEYKDA